MTKVIVTYSDYDPNDLNKKEKVFDLKEDASNLEKLEFSTSIKDFIYKEVKAKYIPGYHLVNSVRLSFINDGILSRHKSIYNFDEEEPENIVIFVS